MSISRLPRSRAWNPDRRGQFSPPEAGSDRERTDLAALVSYEFARVGVLRIEVWGPLDLRCIPRFLAIARSVDDSIATCLLRLNGVTAVFDSGIAALMLLVTALTERGIGSIRIETLDLELVPLDLSPPRAGRLPAAWRRVLHRLSPARTARDGA